jgi:NTP pyrophosphatase (non-canonical NTP hydrolase)
MSDFKDLQKRALEIRQRYEEYETKRSGKPWTNKDLTMGFLVDVGELTEIIMAKEGVRDLEDIDKKLAHEISDCLWCIFVLADKYNLNLEEEFLATMNELDSRLDKGQP